MNEIEQLADQINNLNIDNMANANAIDYQLLRLNVDTIPTFDGSSELTEIFIARCEAVLNDYRAQNNELINSYLIKAIIGKLRDRALIAIGSRTELRTWPDIRNSIRQRFGDLRNYDCLVQDLISLKPLKNEKPLDFAERIQISRSRLASKINSIPINEMSNAAKIIHLEQYDSTALKTFVRGIRGHLQSIIRLRNPQSLEDAVNYVIEEENFQYTLDTPQNYPQKPNNIPLPINNFNRPRSFNNLPPSFNASRPINIQSRQLPPQRIPRFPAIQQQSNHNRDVFRPQGNFQPQFRPTPMSTTTRNSRPPFHQPQPMSISTHNTNFSRNNQYNRPYPQNFANTQNLNSQELFQISNVAPDDFLNNPDNELEFDYYNDIPIQNFNNDSGELCDIYENENNPPENACQPEENFQETSLHTRMK